MKRAWSFAILAAAVLLAAVLWAQGRRPDATPNAFGAARAVEGEAAEIVQSVEQWAAAVRSCNVDRIMSHYLKSEDIVLFDAIPPLEYRGWTAWQKNWRDSLAGIRQIDRWELSGIRARASGDLGYCSAKWRLEMTTQDGGKVALDGRLTQVLQKIGGKWKVIHEHMSVPMASGDGEAGPGKPAEIDEPGDTRYSDPAYRGDGRSGIQGVVLTGPIRPVVRPGEPNERPLPNAIIRVLPLGGMDMIAQGRANAQGQFRIALAPGTYQVMALAPPSGRYQWPGKPHRVVVRPGRFTELVLSHDTGIR